MDDYASEEQAFSWAAAWEKTAGIVLATPEPPTVDRYTRS